MKKPKTLGFIRIIDRICAMSLKRLQPRKKGHLMASLLKKKTVISLAAAFGIFIGGMTAGVYAAPPQPAGQVDQAKLLQPGTLKEMVEGSEDAPVTIVEYASLTCSHCAHFVVKTLPEIREKYINTGKVRLIFREFGYDARAIGGFMLARCVPEDRYFPFIQVLFEKQEDWAFVEDAKGPLLQLAKLAGLNEEKFNACLADQTVLNGLNATFTRGKDEFGIKATPSFFINGVMYEGYMSGEEMSAIIDNLLAGGPAPEVPANKGGVDKSGAEEQAKPEQK